MGLRSVSASKDVIGDPNLLGILVNMGGGKEGDGKDKTPQHFATGGHSGQPLPPTFKRQSTSTCTKIHYIIKYTKIPNHYCCVLKTPF